MTDCNAIVTEYSAKLKDCTSEQESTTFQRSTIEHLSAALKKLIGTILLLHS